MNRDAPMTFEVEPHVIDAPPRSIMRLPGQRLHLVAGVWIAGNCVVAMAYASGLIEGSKARDHLWLDVLLGLAVLGSLGLLFWLLGQVERLEEYVARESVSRGRAVQLSVLCLLLCTCVAASVVESLAVKASDDRWDRRHGPSRQATGS